jgi:uncharacterized C2H2 Zn-finger protein
MGPRNKKVPCPHCNKEFRDDKIARHINFAHTRHRHKERAVYNLSDDMKRKAEEIQKDVEAFRKSPDFDKGKIGRFGPYEFLHGNLTHRDVRRAIVRAHYNWITIAWAESIDGLPSSDEGVYDWYMNNVNLFTNPGTRWLHLLTNDANLHGKLSAAPQTKYKVLPGSCACICNEIGSTPLAQKEVEALVKTKQFHYHLAIECALEDKTSVLAWAQSYLDHNVTDPWAKGANKGFAVTVLDRIRLHHYIHRREASVGLPLHFFIQPEPRWRYQPYRGFWRRVENNLPAEAREINSRLIAEAQEECKACRKAASGYCWQHIDYLNNAEPPRPMELD